ncbi:MAG: hypothetical protein U0Y10_12315 [Spirosomataceae bacterium]
MFKQFIDKLPGADFYLVTSLLIFMLFFVVVGVYLFIMDKQHVQEVSNLPLEG